MSVDDIHSLSFILSDLFLTLRQFPLAESPCFGTIRLNKKSMQAFESVTLPIVQAFVEVESGSVLLGLARRIVQSAPGEATVSPYPLGEPKDFNAFYTWHGHKLRFSMRLMRGAEAACSVRGSPSGWRNESVSTDLHELRWLSRRSRHRTLVRRILLGKSAICAHFQYIWACLLFFTA